MDLTHKRILLTGGAGFLGQYVSEVLRERGCYEVFMPTRAVYDLLHHEDVKSLLDLYKPEVVIHMAASLGGIGANVHTRGQFLYENLTMGLEIMEQSRLRGVEKFVTIGTSCSYPADAPIPSKEEYLWTGFPHETAAPYGVAKMVLILQGQYYRTQYGVNAISVIPSNVYGPKDLNGKEKSHIIPAQIMKCLEAKKTGQPLVVWGTGKATRDFIYATDCAEAIVRATESYDKPEPMNLGSGIETPIRDVIQTIVETLDFKGEVIWDASKPEGNKGRSLDVSRAKKELDFEVTTSLQEGMKRTIEWYLKRLQ